MNLCLFYGADCVVHRKTKSGRAEDDAALRLCIVCTRAAELFFVLRFWNLAYNDVNVAVNQNGAVAHNNWVEFNRWICGTSFLISRGLSLLVPPAASNHGFSFCLSFSWRRVLASWKDKGSIWMFGKSFSSHTLLCILKHLRGLAFSLITAEPRLIPAYRRGNQAGTVESNIWTSQRWCVRSRVCVCRRGFEISSTPSLLTRRRGCVRLAPVGRWLLGSSWTPCIATATPPTIHTHAQLCASLLLPPSAHPLLRSTDLHCVR